MRRPEASALFAVSALTITALLVVATPSSYAAESGITDDEEEQAATPVPAPAPSPRAVAVPFSSKWLEPFFAAGAEEKAAALFRSGDYGPASKELAHVLAGLSEKAPERNPLRFLLALALESGASWQAAGDIFEDLWSTYPLLGPYHAFHAARCRLRRGDIEGAFTWLARVPAGATIEADAAMLKVDAFTTAKRWAEAESETAAYLSRFPKGPRRAEAMFDRAEALRELGRPIEEVAAAYLKVWAETTSEPWASRANDRLEEIARSAPPATAAAITARSVDALLSRGLLLFDANQNTQSETTLSSALSLPGISNGTRCKLRFYMAQSVWKQRQRQRAAPLFDQAVADCGAAGDNDLLVRSLYQGGRCYASTGDRPRALALYAQIEKDHPEHRLADDARLRAAEVYTDDGKDADAEKLLSDLADLYPKGDMGPEALWRLAFEHWQQRDYDKALHWLDENLRRYPHEDIWYAEGRALYWKARIFEKKGEHKKARAAYEQAIREYPLSVYTLFAFERLRRASPETRAQLLRALRKHMGDIDKKSPWKFEKQAIFGEPGFLRAVEFARMGLGSEARRELTKLGLQTGQTKSDSTSAGPKDVLWITAILLDRSGQWNASHAVPRYTLPSFRRRYPDGGEPEAEWRLAYPKAFVDVVRKHCHTNKVPEALQWAIMREESSFYPRAESFANALGLTQLMTRTAQRFAKWPVTREALFDPDKNVEVGSQFLAFLLEHYEGMVPLVISGYNAGEGGVDRWLRERGDLELDEFIETIPFDETRGYTKRVLASYLTYAWLYQSDKSVPPVNFTLKREYKKLPAAPTNGKTNGKSSAKSKKKAT